MSAEQIAMKVYLKVTEDKYELPVEMTYTLEEMARIYKIKELSIYNSIYKAKKRGKRSKWQEVEIEVEQAIDDFFAYYDGVKRNWKLRLHTRTTMTEAVVEIRQKDVTVVRVVASDEEEAFRRALHDLEWWIDRRREERDSKTNGKTARDYYSGSDGNASGNAGISKRNVQNRAV